MTYAELKQKHQEEVNAFPFGFAFSNSQFNEMMANWNLDPEKDLDKLLSIGAGCFIRKQDREKYKEMAERHYQELKDFRKDEKEFVKGLVYQLHNHEYGYSRYDEDLEAALVALGLDLEDVKKDAHLKQMVQKAIKQCIKEFNEMD